MVPGILLEDLRLARLDHEESLALVPLADDGGAVGELLRLERVGDLAAFVEGEGGEQGDLLEEGLVHAAPIKGAVHKDAAEGDAIEGPEGAVGFGADDRGRARGVVHEGQFAEAPAGADAVHLVAHSLWARFDGAGAVDVDVKGALFHNVEVVARVALGDDLDVFGGDGFLDQGAQHERGGFVRQVGEEEVGGDGGFEPVELIGRFRVVGRLPVVIRGGRVEGFGGDGGAAAQAVVGGETVVVAAVVDAEAKRRRGLGGGRGAGGGCIILTKGEIAVAAAEGAGRMAGSTDLRGGIRRAFILLRYVVDIAAGTPLRGRLTGPAEARNGAWERAFSHGREWNTLCGEVVVNLAPKFASGGE